MGDGGVSVGTFCIGGELFMAVMKSCFLLVLLLLLLLLAMGG